MNEEKTIEWTPPATAIPWIVCAACKLGDFIAAGPRHFDETMYRQVEVFVGDMTNHDFSKWEQGFIDQFGRYYTREEAMEIVKQNGQPFSVERNSGDTMLFSEGLY